MTAQGFRDFNAALPTHRIFLWQHIPTHAKGLLPGELIAAIFHPPLKGARHLRARLPPALQNQLAQQALIAVLYLTPVQPSKLVPAQLSRLLPELDPGVWMTSLGTGQIGPLMMPLLSMTATHPARSFSKDSTGSSGVASISWSPWGPLDDLARHPGGRADEVAPCNTVMLYSPN